ncbi:hypothetical protein A1D29_09690 [Pasteurellaceae bacterium Orientalotternb1]|nr:hypothetical protein A1D29_09690 [Pasteurellaceae bacterium Orientalotternb1]
MTTLKSLFVASLLVASTSVLANPVSTAMKQMNSQLSTLTNAADSAAFEQSADAFLTASKSAQRNKPKDLNDAEYQDYQAGLQQVIDIVEQSKKLAAEGKLPEAKAALGQLDAIKKTYHKKYK